MAIDGIGDEILAAVHRIPANHGHNAPTSSGRIAIRAEGVEVECRTLTLIPLR